MFVKSQRNATKNQGDHSTLRTTWVWIVLITPARTNKSVDGFDHPLEGGLLVGVG